MKFLKRLLKNIREGYAESEIEDRIIRGEIEHKAEKPKEQPPVEASMAVEGKKFCIGCFAELDMDSKFCQECGRKQII